MAGSETDASNVLYQCITLFCTAWIPLLCTACGKWVHNGRIHWRVLHCKTFIFHLWQFLSYVSSSVGGILSANDPYFVVSNRWLMYDVVKKDFIRWWTRCHHATSVFWRLWKSLRSWNEDLACGCRCSERSPTRWSHKILHTNDTSFGVITIDPHRGVWRNCHYLSTAYYSQDVHSITQYQSNDDSLQKVIFNLTVLYFNPTWNYSGF